MTYGCRYKRCSHRGYTQREHQTPKSFLSATAQITSPSPIPATCTCTKFRDQYMVKEGPKNSGRGLPPPLSGNAPKNFLPELFPKVFSGNCLVFGSCQPNLPSQSGDSFLPYNLPKLICFLNAHSCRVQGVVSLLLFLLTFRGRRTMVNEW